MAVKRQYTRSVPVQLTEDWYTRIKTIADDPRCNLSMATVIRDCVENVVPGIEMQLGLVDLEEMAEEQNREPQPSDGPDYHADHASWEARQAVVKKKEDRTAGLAWGPPRPE